MGVLLILNENTGLNKFKEKYQLTDRQFEIIMLVTKGLSNIEIETELKLKRRTIENHLYSVYRKLEISNKVELIRIVSEFNII